jgi:predicted amidohydrolase
MTSPSALAAIPTPAGQHAPTDSALEIEQYTIAQIPEDERAAALPVRRHVQLDRVRQRPERPAGLLVAAAQWLATPGDPAGNLEAARHWIGQAAAAGADLVVLPELWPCGYDVATLASDAAAAAEPVPGPRTAALGALAERNGLWVFAGSVPERDGDAICNTALVFNRDGALVARHRKAHLYRPTGEHALFAPGGRLTSFSDPELGHVAVTVCYDGDFPEVGRALAARGADLVIQPSAYEWEAAAYWDRYYPGAALAGGQWWVLVNQCGTTGSGTLLGASKVISPAGEVLAEARRAVPPTTGPPATPEPELLLCRLQETEETKEARAFAELLRQARRPGLYGE